MNGTLRIIIADDHPIFRGGLRQIIENQRNFKVIAEASDGAGALSLIEREQPDIVILDVNMPQMSGFEVAKALGRIKFGGGIIFLTMHSEEAMFNKAMDLGAKGYLLKDSAAVDIINCLQAVANHQSYASAAITAYLFKRASRATEKTTGVRDLTQTERIILRRIAGDKTSREIADELCISLRTVDTHRYNICQKLDLHGSNALIKFALKHQHEI